MQCEAAWGYLVVTLSPYPLPPLYLCYSHCHVLRPLHPSPASHRAHSLLMLPQCLPRISVWPLR